MNPKLSNLLEDKNVLHFTLSNINVSLANALRRIMLSEIPTVVFYTENYKDNQCKIEINTSRMHNEIVKQRLSCIPIHMKDLELLTDKYIMEVDVKNDTDNIIYVTTEDFKIKNKATGNYLTEEETHKIFPKNHITQQYIDFVRLRPRISDTIPGEQLKLSCEFSVSSAKVNSMFNVVSKCSYANTPDMVKVNEIWDSHEKKLRAEDNTAEEIEFQRKNFLLLDAQRYYVNNSFDFVVQSVGVYDNKEIVVQACVILQNKFVDLIQQIDADTVPIVISETSMKYCYDIVLENEDYTIGKVLEYLLYETYYLKDKRLNFCGFKKLHPHNLESIIRIAFATDMDKNDARQCLRSVCVDAQEVYKKLYEMFR
jgi:DNA-directed RNA polymerase II subunit RPB3